MCRFHAFLQRIPVLGGRVATASALDLELGDELVACEGAFLLGARMFGGAMFQTVYKRQIRSDGYLAHLYFVQLIIVDEIV